MDQDKNPVNEYREKKAKAMNDTFADMGFGGGGDKKANRAQADKSNAELDRFEDDHGIGKAAKGPSAASRIGKAFRNFGSRVQNFFSPKAAPPVTQATQTMDHASNTVEAKPLAPTPTQTPEMGFSRADARAAAAKMSSRAETLAVAKTMTDQQKGAKPIEHGLGR